MKISTSDISTFLRCRQLWDYTADIRQNYTTTERAPALYLGTGVHLALERFYGDLADPVATFKEWFVQGVYEIEKAGLDYDQDEFHKIYLLGIAMLEGYLRTYGDDPTRDADGMQVLAVEQEFEIPIPGTADGVYVGRMDGLLLDAMGRVWVLENKTYSSKYPVLPLHNQLLGYPWAATQLSLGHSQRFVTLGIAGKHIEGALYNGLRKQALTSRVKDPNSLFVREWVRRSRTELSRFGTMLAAIYNEMTNPNVAIYPTMSQDCGRCGFRDPCLARLRGNDERWLLANNFTERPPRGGVYTQTEQEEEALA